MSIFVRICILHSGCLAFSFSIKLDAFKTLVGSLCFFNIDTEVCHASDFATDLRSVHSQVRLLSMTTTSTGAILAANGINFYVTLQKTCNFADLCEMYQSTGRLCDD